MACESNNIEIITKILAKSPDIDFIDEKGMTGLDYLLQNNNADENAITLIKSYSLKKKLESELTEQVTKQKKHKI